MKEADLKKSETKKIIIATYAMAAEALDIKSLTTLILATPRTDITQAVGRILRVKHERPLVIDIIDSHDVFKRQWKKRLTYYKKNKYNVITTTSLEYGNGPWQTVNSNTKVKQESSNTLTKGKCLISV